MPGATGQDAGEARTSIDALVELLRVKGKSELNTIAVQLGADPKIVERWAKVLEGGGMARISYEVGRMYLEPIVIGKEEVQSVKVKLGARESILGQSANVQRAELDKFAEKITGLSMSVANIEGVYRQRMPEVQLMLAEINKSYAQVEAEQKGIAMIKQNVEATYGDVNRRINDLSSKIDMLTAAGGEKGVAANIDKVNELLKRSSAAMSEIEELRKTKDRFFESMKKSIDSQVGEFNRQLDSTSSEIELRLKVDTQQIQNIANSVNNQASVTKNLASQIKEFKRHSESAKRTLNSARVEFSDKYQKLNENIYRNGKIVESNSAAVLEKIGTLKSAFGDVSKLDDTVRGLRRDVEDMNKQIAESKAELSNISDGLRALNAPNLSVEQRAELVDQLADKDRSTKIKVARIGKKIDDANKRLNSEEV